MATAEAPVRAIPARVLAQLGWWEALTTPGTRRVLAVGALLDSAGTGLAAVVLPFFVLRVAALPTGAFAAILAAGGVAELATAVPAGWLAGRLGLWRYAIATRLGRAACYTAVAFCGSVPALLALSVVIGVLRAGGNGLNQSVTAAVVAPGERGATLAVTRAVRNLGYLLSGGLAALVLTVQSDALVRAALIVNAVSFLAGALLLRRIRPARGAAEVRRRVDFSVLRDVRFLGLIVSAAVFASTVRVLDVALPLLVLARPGVPSAMVAAAVTLNTVLVVVLQHRLSRSIDGVAAARRGLRRATIFLVGMALVLAALPGGPPAIVMGGVVAAAVLLTLGEMTESPAWWTLAYEQAPRERTTEYLAAFDLSYALLNIAGPPLLVLVVGHGSTGWAAYAAGVVAALALAHACIRETSPTPASEKTEPSP
nr:MFS transporter [uncultured Actinoplanes sp.]